MVLFHPYCPRDYFQICSLLLSKQPLMYIIWTQLSVQMKPVVFGHNIQLRDTCLKDANVKIHILCCLFSISNTNSKNSTCNMSLRSNHTVWTASGTDRRPNHERAPRRSLQERNQTHLSKLEVGVEWVECLCLCVCVYTSDSHHLQPLIWWSGTPSNTNKPSWCFISLSSQPGPQLCELFCTFSLWLRISNIYSLILS